MKSIWKFVFEMRSGIHQIDMPAGSIVLAFANNHEEPVIWAFVDVNEPKEKRRFRLRHTGETFEKVQGRYIGTAQFDNGNYVLHCFQESP